MTTDYPTYLSTFGSTKFKDLWPAQADVLSKYSSSCVDLHDVGIELPTGSGKTLIALLIAGAKLADGRKVAILSANKTLARQMFQEARSLGIPATLMEGRGVDISAQDKRSYQRCQAVAIMNYWVYFNQNPVVDAADLLIMDDAHLAEQCLNSLYSVEIRKHDNAELFAKIVRELQARFPEYAILADALSENPPPTATAELLSFIDHIAVAGRLKEILDEATLDTDSLFRWNRLRNQLKEANLYIGRSSIWLRPYVYPLISNAHYGDAQQVIYLSATLGDEGDLSRRLGVRPVEKIPVPSIVAEATSGRRLVVMNRMADEDDLPERLQTVLKVALGIHPKCLWLCSSDAEARGFMDAVAKWSAAVGLGVQQAWLLSPLGDEIDQFRKANAGHLFVAGRFDGMDFQGDECRVVVLTTVPRAINLQEEFITSYLRDSDFMRKRQNQRIVQALGRCNRSADDFGVYLLADQRFAQYFGRESNREGISSNVIAEIDMAQDLAERPDDEVAESVRCFLQGDFQDYDRDIARYRAGVGSLSAAKGAKADTAKQEVVGWAALFQSQDYVTAAERFEECWTLAKAANLNEFGALHGWHWAKALFLESVRDNPNVRAKSLQVLEMAIARGGSSWFNRMRASVARIRNDASASAAARDEDYREAVLRAADDLLERVGASGNKFQKRIDQITAGLASERHAEYQEGLERLGERLAYAASRPKYGTATDCRWRGVFGNHREVITFEAKIEHSPSNQISASDLGQAHNQEARAIGEYAAAGYAVRSTVVSHMTRVHDDAVSSVGTLRIIDRYAISALWEHLATLLSLYRSQWSLDNIEQRVAAAQILRPYLPKTGWLIRVLEQVPAVAIDATSLLREWPALG